MSFYYRIINKELSEVNKLIRFHHPYQDLKKVCTDVQISYNGSSPPDKEFFLENQNLKDNTFELPIPENKKSVKIKISKSQENYDLEKLNIEII